MGGFPSEFELSTDARDHLIDAFQKFVLGLILTFTLFPIFMMIATSLKSESELYRDGLHLLPSTLNVQNYVDMWARFDLVGFFLNSLIIAGTTTVICLTVGSLAAYAFSRYEFPGKGLFGLTILSTQMIPGVLILIPIFILYITVQREFGVPMINTYHGIIFIYSTFTVPFAIWMLRGYFDTIPAALEDAARIDGCTRLQALYRIVLPLAMPGIAATGMFVFIIAFNEVLFASAFANDGVTPFAIGIQKFQTSTGTHWTEMMAAATVSSVPLLLIFGLFQKQIVSGLTAGSVKQ
ncbi:carbohydrate ABC transporter permease [Halocatena halophila]|uniref:carbohydrate ABC transporter permease n=1 Tax=Halocatena halophila TaxID=2814576 RepID=UPI002ED2FF16